MGKETFPKLITHGVNLFDVLDEANTIYFGGVCFVKKSPDQVYSLFLWENELIKIHVDSHYLTISSPSKKDEVKIEVRPFFGKGKSFKSIVDGQVREILSPIKII